MDGLKRLFVGVSHDPKVVGTFRAFVLYALPLGVGALVAYLSALHDPRWLWLGALIPVIRAVEGALIDQVFKASQNEVHPPSPAGETPPPAVPAKPEGIS